jgi:SH3-like domain-containing protein
LVVEPGGVALRSEPREDLAAIDRLQPGVEVERVDQLPGWTRVATAGGTRGWLPDDAVFALRR